MKHIIRIRLIACMILSVCLTDSTALARDLHVDPIRGDDQQDGITHPVKSIRQAVKLATAGDTIHLQPMVYYDYAGFYSKQGEPEKPITLDGHNATLEGSEPIDARTWVEDSPGMFRCDSLIPNLNEAILARWFFLFNGKMNRMGRVLKGKSEPFRKPKQLQPGEWTFEEKPQSAGTSPPTNSLRLILHQTRGGPDSRRGQYSLSAPIRRCSIQWRQRESRYPKHHCDSCPQRWIQH